MKPTVKNPFNIRINPQEHFILRSADTNYMHGMLSVTRTFDVYNESMQHIGTITCKCTTEHGHTITGHTLSPIWSEAVDCITERDFRAAIAHTFTIFKTNRYY